MCAELVGSEWLKTRFVVSVALASFTLAMLDLGLGQQLLRAGYFGGKF